MQQHPSVPLTALQLEDIASTLNLITYVEEFDILGCSGPNCRIAVKFKKVLHHLKNCHPTVPYSHPAVKKLYEEARQTWLAQTEDTAVMENSTQEFWSNSGPIGPSTFFGEPQMAYACPANACIQVFGHLRSFRLHFTTAHKAEEAQDQEDPPLVQAYRVQPKQWRIALPDHSTSAIDPDLDRFLAALSAADPNTTRKPEALPSLQPFYKQLNWWQDRKGMTFQEWKARLELLVDITSSKPRTDQERTIVATIDKWFAFCFDPVIKGFWSSSLRTDLMRAKHWSEHEADNFSPRPFAKLQPDTEKTYKTELHMLFLYISRRYSFEPDDPSGLAIHEQRRSPFLGDWLNSINDQHPEHAVSAFQSVMFFLATEASPPEQQVLVDFNRDAQASLKRPSQDHTSFSLASPASICKRISGLVHMFRLTIGNHIYRNSATCYEFKSTRRTKLYDTAMASAHGEAPEMAIHSLRRVSNTVAAFINQTSSSIKVIWAANPVTGESMDGVAIKGSVVRIATIQRAGIDAIQELGAAVDNLLPGLSRADFPIITEPDNLEMKSSNYSYFDNLSVTVNGTEVRTPEYAFNFARERGFTVKGFDSLFTEDFRSALIGKSKSFNKLLMAVIHLTQSMPARAPESCDILIRNEPDLRRQLYFITGQLVVKRTHSKADTVRQDSTNLVHWWDPTMSSIVLHYLAFIRPIELFLLASPQASDKNTETGVHVARFQLFHYMGVEISSDMYKDAFTTFAARFLGPGTAHFSTWRHLAHALAESKIVDFATAQERQHVSSLLVMSSNHTLKTAQTTYGITNLDIPGVATSNLNLMKNTCGIYHKFFREENITTPPTNVFSKPRLDYHESSLALTSSMPSTTPSGSYWNRQPPQDHNKFFSHTITASFREATAQAKKYLPIYLGCPPAHATFKSPEQALAATLAIEGKKDLLITMPVGAGKTLIALLAALVDSAKKTGFTILMVPLRALEAQFLEICGSLNIKAYQWHSFQSASFIDPFQGVLVVSPEQFTNSDFQSFLQAPAFAGRVKRLVVDEAHLAESWRTFRESMAQIGRYRPTSNAANQLHHVQLIALTGTCPTFLREKIVQHLNIAGPNLVLINQHTRNTTTKFVAEVYDTPASFEADGVLPWLHCICQQVQLNLESNIPNRALVYVTNKLHADQFSNWTVEHYPVLNSNYFTGDLDSQAKSILYEKWKNHHVNILFCTSAFGLGIDDTSCTVVLRIGMGRSMMGLIQESGRCGRAGGKSLSVTLTNKRNSQNIADDMPTESDYVLRKDFERLVPSFLDLKTCLGATLADFLELPVSASLPCSSHPHISEWTYCTVCETEQLGAALPTKAARRASNFAAARESLTWPMSGTNNGPPNMHPDIPSSETGHKRPRAS